jgi:hypothetical protein
LRTARTQTANASRVARRLANRSTTETTAAAAAQALTLAGTQYDSLLQTLTGLVGDGVAQAPIAGAIQPTLAGKEQILQFLTGLLDEVPASVQPTLASIIAALGTSGASAVVNLDAAASSGTLPSTISDIVTSCLASATQAIENAFAMIQSILPQLPVASQLPIGSILTQVTGIVGSLVPSVLSTITGLIDTIIGSLPVVGGGATGGLFGGLLGNIVGGGTTSVPGAGNVDNTISSLLGGLLGGGSGSGSSPLAGAGGIISTVTNLIGSLLGGILPGVVPAT